MTNFTITTDRREITVSASNRKGAPVHAAVLQLASGERVLTVRVA